MVSPITLSIEMLPLVEAMLISSPELFSGALIPPILISPLVLSISAVSAEMSGRKISPLVVSTVKLSFSERFIWE